MSQNDLNRRYSFDHNLKYGVPTDDESDFVSLAFDEAMTSPDLEGYMHAAHGMIYCIHKDLRLWDRYKQPASIMMQQRCDGNLGFPGGLLDKTYQETVVAGLNRELAEEIHLDLDKHGFVQSEHVSTHVVHKKKLVLHFYAKEVTLEEYKAIERRTLDSEEWGIETFGVTRVPLFAMDDGYRGFPVFLANQFAGNARSQLVLAIRERRLLSDEDVDTFIGSYNTYAKLNIQS